MRRSQPSRFPRISIRQHRAVRLLAGATALLAVLSVSLWGMPSSAQADDPALPSLTISDGTVSFAEGGEPVVVDPALTIAGSALAEVTGATVTIEDAQAGDVLGVDASVLESVDGVTGAFDGPSGVLTFDGAATAGDYQALLRTVTFEAGEGTDPEPRGITFSIDVDVDPLAAGFYNTGVDDSGTPLSLGEVEGHW